MLVVAGAYSGQVTLIGCDEYSSYMGRVQLTPQLFCLGKVAYVHLLLGAQPVTSVPAKTVPPIWPLMLWSRSA